jgi:hypothetical protein
VVVARRIVVHGVVLPDSLGSKADTASGDARRALAVTVVVVEAALAVVAAKSLAVGGVVLVMIVAKGVATPIEVAVVAVFLVMNSQLADVNVLGANSVRDALGDDGELISVGLDFGLPVLGGLDVAPDGGEFTFVAVGYIFQVARANTRFVRLEGDDLSRDGGDKCDAKLHGG